MNRNPVPKDQILNAVGTVRALGTETVLERLQDREPNVASFLTENFQRLEEEVRSFGADPSIANGLLQQIQRFAVACVLIQIRSEPAT